MALSEKYQQASFRAINFFIRSEDVKGGKKFVSHEYPNSNRRFVEELGLNPGVFAIQGFIHGDSAIEQKQNLERAFQAEGVGVLIHPLYGRLEVKSTVWNFSSVETDLGEIAFKVTFYESEVNISLTPDLTSLSKVTAAADVARGIGYQAIKANIAINKAKSAVEKTQLIAGTIMDIASGKVRSLSDLDPAALSAFDQVFGTSTRNLFQAAVSADELATTFETFYESLRTVAPPEAQKQMWSDLTTYDSDLVIGSLTTVIRTSISTNEGVLDGHTKTNALINFYESSVATTYNTVDELKETRAELDEKFNTLLGSEAENPLAGEGELRDAIQVLRSLTNDALDQKAENAYNLTSIRPGETSVALLSYFLYGSLDNEDSIRQLNEGLNSADIDNADSVEVLS